MPAKHNVQSSEKLGKLIGDALRKKRVAMGVSQEDFAELADQHRTYVGAVERGERNPTIHTLAQIAAAFGQSPSQFLKDAGL
jgi:transcriptional regulator with XRE-family HTH domain